MKERNEHFHKVFFPLSAKYDPKWIRKNSLGENVLYNLESLCEVMDFKQGMTGTGSRLRKSSKCDISRQGIWR